MEICSSYRCAATQHKCIAVLLRARCNYHCSVLLCSTGSHQAVCHSRFTYVDLLFIQVCSDPAQMHWTLFRARCNYHRSVLLCKTGSHKAVCHCRFNYGDLLFIQVSSDPAQMHCNSIQGKMQSPQFSAALQKRLTPGSVSQQIHLWRSALHAGVQRYSTNALQLCSGQNAVSTVQCCSAIPAHTRQFGTADSPLEICSSYRCAATQHKCIAVLLRERCSSHCSVLLCKTGSRQAVCHSRFTYGDLLCTPVWRASFYRYNCNDTRLLLACFAKQQNSREAILPWPVLQCFGVASLHTRMKSRSP